MNKSLYSLMLMDNVVREIDKLAMQRNTNRSNIVNQILAEYVSMITPEKRIEDIFRHIESVMSAGEIIPYVVPNQLTMSLKSSLEYKYRPTIRYEVSMYRQPGEAIGELSVIFRTQSAALLTLINQFFVMWRRLEDCYLKDRFKERHIEYALYEGRFTRSISLPANRNYTNDNIADSITAYICMLDDLMKGFLNQRYSPQDVEMLYREYLNKGVGLL